jgi:hypothetical protein
MPEIHPGLITYCTNIHPGETWAETFAALAGHIPAVKAAVSPESPFPVGLRLSNRAARELSAEGTGQFSAWLGEHGCFVPTINGFPYGSFHGGRVKDKVYLPDWRSSDRTAYTIALADLLANLLPEGITGSISTVPVGFKGVVLTGDFTLVRVQLHAVLRHLSRILREHGKKIVLALEPEPGCIVETTDELCRFFGAMAFPPDLQPHLGICLDCCHQAVQFEEPAECLSRLNEAGIPIAKVQASSAIRLVDPGDDLLRSYDEPCYLHQVVIRRRDGTLLRYPDLPDALTRHQRVRGDEWRCHFHVPIFLAGTGTPGTTRSFLEELLHPLPKGILLEVETYTWDVLPPELRSGSVTDSIIREITWLKEQTDAAHRRP